MKQYGSYCRGGGGEMLEGNKQGGILFVAGYDNNHCFHCLASWKVLETWRAKTRPFSCLLLDPHLRKGDLGWIINALGHCL